MRTFNPDSISCETNTLLQHTQQVDAVAGINFFGHAPELKVANMLFREVVGWIHSLNYSLLGMHPQCAEQLDINPKLHGGLRKFEDVEGLADYKEYLFNLILKSTTIDPDLQPRLEDAGDDDAGFTYTVHSKRAQISLHRRSDEYGGWDVRGIATFNKPEQAEHISATLTKHGFDVFMVCVTDVTFTA